MNLEYKNSEVWARGIDFSTSFLLDACAIGYVFTWEGAAVSGCGELMMCLNRLCVLFNRGMLLKI